MKKLFDKRKKMVYIKDRVDRQRRIKVNNKLKEEIPEKKY